MQTLSRAIRRNSSGYALIIILFSLAVMMVAFLSLMSWVSNNSTVNARYNQYIMSEAAAEAAVEKVLSQMNFDYVQQSLSNSETHYAIEFLPTLTNEQASWPIKYVYSDTNGVANQISVHLGKWTTNTVPLGSQYTNLYGLEQDITITATATPVGQSFNVPATIQEVIKLAAIPLFQFAIFYNLDLEIDPGAAMNIKGSVWSNGGIWSGTPNVTYSSTVGAVGNVYFHDNIRANPGVDPFCTTKVDSGGVDSGTPTANFANTPTSGSDRITMPIGTNNDPATVAGLVNLPPDPYTLNTSGAITTNGQLYFANSADLYLTNFSTGVYSSTPRGSTMILYYQDGINSPIQTQLPYDFYIITNRTMHNIFNTNFIDKSANTNIINNVANVLYSGYSFLANVLFYDWREGWNGGSGVNSGKGRAVQAVQIDIGKYNTWLTNSTAKSNGASYWNDLCKQPDRKSHPIDSIYIYNGVQPTSTTMPAVRIYNGIMLPTQTAPKGFTVATAMPLYVFGDYNAKTPSGSSLGKNSTTYTWPAALIGDSITILSDGWADNVTSKLPPALTTTVNAAMVEGIVRSTNNVYSGGVENFLRLLENWGNVNLWYNGSIVVMFPSQIATSYQLTTGNYYQAPVRQWSFDTNFTQQVGLPPLTPQAKGVIRDNWNAFYRQ